MAVVTRRARENARRRSLHYVEHTTKRDVDTTPGMEEVESRREQRPRYAVAVDSW
jgi:hypothetical protein